MMEQNILQGGPSLPPVVMVQIGPILVAHLPLQPVLHLPQMVVSTLQDVLVQIHYYEAQMEVHGPPLQIVHLLFPQHVFPLLQMEESGLQ